MATISLTDVTNLRVIQRNSSNQGSLNISGTCSGATSIEARIVDDGTSDEVVTWTEIDASPTTTFSGTLSGISQGGWYNVQVRVGNETATTDNGTNKFGIGILVGCTGQSNMEYWFDPLHGTDLTANSLLSAYDGSWAAPTANGAVSFGNTLISTVGIPVGLFDYGVGGAALNAAAEDGSGYWLDLTANEPYDSFIDGVTAGGGELEFILWDQGQTDILSQAVSEAQYETDLGTLLTRFESAITAPTGTLNFVIISQARMALGVSTYDDDSVNIRKAQRDFANDNSNVYISCENTDLSLTDTYHYTDASYTTVGQRAAQAVLYALGEVTFCQGPYVSAGEQISSTVVDVTIVHRGGSDCTPTGATSATGFKLYDDGVEETITSVLRQDTTTYRITTSGSLDGYITFKYADKAEPSVTNAVKDNTSLTLPLDASLGAIPTAITAMSKILLENGDELLLEAD